MRLFNYLDIYQQVVLNLLGQGGYADSVRGRGLSADDNAAYSPSGQRYDGAGLFAY